ncbi:hypothetical protein [Rubrobacter radiotolerans]|uniref:Uncharacterized protein n=1 Tax=Rubrobacter radiotolerans TaxID=42256 RepID=A0AB35TE45_RUBRA|nr:hypothetical protein [Rubrobacter radiotolerans]MDX5895605.1 hypothetical protein [Rubrobacter radiotolerans]
MLSRYARRACSMSLVKAADHCTWEEAASALDIPPVSGRAMANKVVSLLNALGTADRFDATLRDIVARVARRGSLVDYGMRRRALAGFTVIEWEEWREMCRGVGVHLAFRGGR